MCFTVTHFSLLSSFEPEEKNALGDIPLWQNYESFSETNFLLSVSRTCTCQKSVTFFLADICLFHQKLAMKYVGRFFCNVGIEGWKIARWQESQNNIDTL